MCLWSLLRAAGLLRLCVARPLRLPVSLLAGLVTLSYTKYTLSSATSPLPSSGIMRLKVVPGSRLVLGLELGLG